MKIIVTWKNQKEEKEVVYLKDESIINDFSSFKRLSQEEKKKTDSRIYEKEETGKFMIDFNDVKKIDSDDDDESEIIFG